MSNRDDEAEARPEYKVLKKRMKAGFKEIRKAVKKGRQVDQDSVRAFCADAHLMTTYPDKGDEYYPLFRQWVDVLADAAVKEDWGKLVDAVAEVRRREKDCHKRFK